MSCSTKVRSTGRRVVKLSAIELFLFELVEIQCCNHWVVYQRLTNVVSHWLEPSAVVRESHTVTATTTTAG